MMTEIRTPAVADVYAADTATAVHATAGVVYAFDILADIEPDALARIAGVCVVANVAPRHMNLVRVADQIQVHIELCGITTATADSIRRKLAQLTCVNSVVLTALHA